MTTLLLARRRARRDLPQLLGTAALACAAAILASIAPLLVTSSLDAGARSAVSQAGHGTDIVARIPVGVPGPEGTGVPLTQAQAVLDALPDTLPPELAAVAGSRELTVLSPEFESDITALSVQVGQLSPPVRDAVRIVEGVLPGDDDEVLAGADAGLTVGQQVSLDCGSSKCAPLTVVGTIEPSGDQSVMLDLPTVLDPLVTRSKRGETQTAITLLASAATVDRMQQALTEPWDALIRVRLDPSAFTAADIASVTTSIDALRSDGSPLTPSGTFADVRVSSGFADSIRGFAAKAAGASAQMTLVLVGALGVAVAAILLVSRLLVLRRAGELSLERARGATLAAIGARVGVEAAAASILGGVVALLVTLPLAGAPGAPIIAVVLLATLTPIVQSVLIARASWSGRRTPTDRLDRQALLARRRLRRLVLELTIAAATVAAVVAAIGRGLSDDPLLSVAPLLVAVSIALVVLRVFPVVMRGIAEIGMRSRGALGLIGATQATRSVSVLPLVALTLATALAVGGGLLLLTVREGQVDASWQRIGAELRVDGPADGLEGAHLYVETQVPLTAPVSVPNVTVLGVDDAYAQIMDTVPDLRGAGPVGAFPALDELDVVVEERLADSIPADGVTMLVNGVDVPIHVVGTVEGGPSGYIEGVFLYVDLDALETATGVEPNMLLSDSVSTAAAGDGITRAGWLADRRGDALASGVDTAMAVSALAAAVFAALALVASALGGSRDRRRSLALLRTLGMRPGLGAWLQAAELVPVVVAALVGGIAAGIVTAVVIGPSLGLQALAGGLTAPAPVISAGVILGVCLAAVVLLGVAMTVEVLAHRRDRLSEVLRVGEAQ